MEEYFSFFRFPYEKEKKENLLSFYKDYQQNTLLGCSDTRIYLSGYTYLHYHWYIDYYSQYLYIVWMYIFFHTEDKYIVYLVLSVEENIHSHDI